MSAIIYQFPVKRNESLHMNLYELIPLADKHDIPVSVSECTTYDQLRNRVTLDLLIAGIIKA